MQQQQQDAVQWARTVEPGRTLTFAELEEAMLERPLPPKRSLSGGARVGQVIALVLLAGIVLAIVAAPLVGPAIVIAHGLHVDRLTTIDMLPAARIAFVITAALPQGVLAIWWLSRERHRRWWDLPVTGLIALLSAASLAVSLAVGGLDVGFLVWIGFATIAATGACIGILVASRPGPPPPKAVLDDDDQRFGQVRAEVLTILQERQLVEGRPSTVRLHEMPKGGWRDLAPFEEPRRGGRTP